MNNFECKTEIIILNDKIAKFSIAAVKLFKVLSGFFFSVSKPHLHASHITRQAKIISTRTFSTGIFFHPKDS